MGAPLSGEVFPDALRAPGTDSRCSGAEELGTEQGAPLGHEDRNRVGTKCVLASQSVLGWAQDIT